ncbi:hypothetical protein TNCV_2895571 [Trichonephila clavipes]|nr:hypothetical protein TNCV_2895571 [Trichonephila clavipes]
MKKYCSKNNTALYPPGFEPGTFCVLGRCDNHYTMVALVSRETCGQRHCHCAPISFAALLENFYSNCSKMFAIDCHYPSIDVRIKLTSYNHQLYYPTLFRSGRILIRHDFVTDLYATFKLILLENL